MNLKKNRKIITSAGIAIIASMAMTLPVYADASSDVSDAGAGEKITVHADVDNYAFIRRKATTDSEAIAIFKPEDSAVVTGEENGWTKISFGKLNGYVRSDLLAYDSDYQDSSADSSVTGSSEDDSALSEEGDSQNADSAEQESAESDSQDADSDDEDSSGLAEESDDAETGADDQTSEESDESISDADQTAAEAEETIYDASEAERKLLASIIFCEAGGESYEGKIAVGAVVMNRVESASFPNTISDVVYQSGQFTPAMTGWLGSVLAGDVNSSCYDAADAALAGEDPTNGCLYFHAGGGSGLTIGNQTFY